MFTGKNLIVHERGNLFAHPLHLFCRFASKSILSLSLSSLFSSYFYCIRSECFGSYTDSFFLCVQVLCLIGICVGSSPSLSLSLSLSLLPYLQGWIVKPRRPFPSMHNVAWNMRCQPRDELSVETYR
eukprot:TRINITY_DN1064_c1_g2_i6.p1 TRINITY_DN1064_c1_g2~~TRINITY_DN1064_c1_g2_i6.p1  ORF type:complete len:127 (+),score=5.65 TRINITY_DN1064_c1_g2_i6:528-908(+)